MPASLPLVRSCSRTRAGACSLFSTTAGSSTALRGTTTLGRGSCWPLWLPARGGDPTLQGRRTLSSQTTSPSPPSTPRQSSASARCAGWSPWQRPGPPSSTEKARLLWCLMPSLGDPTLRGSYRMESSALWWWSPLFCSEFQLQPLRGVILTWPRWLNVLVGRPQTLG